MLQILCSSHDATNEEADFVFLGRQGEHVMGCTTIDLLLEQDTNKLRFLEKKILGLIGYEYNFIVRYNPGSGNRGRPNFNVISATPSTTLPKELEAPTATSKEFQALPSSSPKTPTKSTAQSKKTESTTSGDKAIAKEETTPKKKNHQKRRHGIKGLMARARLISRKFNCHYPSSML